MSRTLAVVTTYRPDVPRLRGAMDALRAQADALFVFDNASGDARLDAYLRELENAGACVRRSPANVGLGAAMNVAIDHAKAHDFSHVLLMDQDSVAGEDMLAELHEALDGLSKMRKVGAVGPVHVDARNGHAAPFVRIGFPFNRKLHGAAGQCIEADFLISSGSLIPLAVLDDVGGMDAGLFIDNIDLDWSFRARRAGFALFGAGDARMQHAIGDTVRKSWLQPGGVHQHAPLRLYYIMRNRTLLYRRASTPKTWIAQDLLRLPVKFAATLLWQSPRRAYLRCMLRGLRDGACGKSGPAPF